MADIAQIKIEIDTLSLSDAKTVLRSAQAKVNELTPKPEPVPAWLHKDKMYAFKNPECVGEDVFENCNLMQVLPDTKIMVGNKVTLKNCQLTNVKLTTDMTVEGGNTCKWDFCSHNHPKFERYGLPVCKEFCRHWKAEEEIYEDILLGQSPIPKVVAEVGVK